MVIDNGSFEWPPSGGGGGGGSVTDVTASTPLTSTGGSTPNIALTAVTANRALQSSASGFPAASTVTDTELAFVSGVTSSIQTQLNSKGSGTVTSVGLTVPGVIFISPVSGSPVTSSGTLALALNTQVANRIFSGPSTGADAAPTFRALVAADIPAISLTTGVTGTLPIANGGTGQTTANTAFNALAPSQTSNAGLFLTTDGTNSSWSSVPTGAMPSAHASSTSIVTSATTTYVTAISTTITTTAASAPISAKATATFTVTGAIPTVLKYRVSINGVAGQEQLLSLTALTTNYTAATQYLSAALGPGTYTVLFEIARNSGTGTVSFFEGTLDVIGLQGGNANGITQLTGALQAGPGSGSQVLSGVLPVANGGTALSATTINQLLYSSANNVISGLATANTAALVTSSTGVPSWASGATANRVLRTNGTTVSFAQVAAATDISGTLPVANGGTGLTAAFAAGRIIFSNGTTFASDALFQYTTANTRFIVGQGGGTGRINGTVSTTDPTPNDLAGNFFSRATTNNCVNIQNENTLPTIDMTNSGGTTVGANILAEASRGTLAARTQSVAGDTLFSINTHGRTASAWSTGLAANISIVTTDTVTDTTNGGEIVFSATANSGTTPVERLRVRQSGETNLVNSHLKSTQTTAPTVVAGASAGTGATASLARATDVAGEVTINTGALGVSTGSYATITFNKAYLTVPIVVLTPANGTISTSVYVTATTTTFDVNFALAGGISSTYLLNYHVIETQ